MATNAWEQFVPEDWATYNPSQKIGWLNEQRVGSDILSNLGIAQGDIDWMKSQGYAGSYEAPTGIAGLAAFAPTPTPAPPPPQVQSGLTSLESKVGEYERLRGAGLSDADIRASAEQIYGAQNQSDWDYLVGLTQYAPPPAPAPAVNTSAVPTYDPSKLGAAQQYYVASDVSEDAYWQAKGAADTARELVVDPYSFQASVEVPDNYEDWVQQQYMLAEGAARKAEDDAITGKLGQQLLAGWAGLGENVGIGSAGTPQAEIGGRSLSTVAADFARRLREQGITDLSQARFDPGSQAAWTAEGRGNVSLVATADGRLIPVWGSSSDASKARQVALALGSAWLAPGLAGALGGGIAGGAGAGAILGGVQAGITGGDVLKGALLGGLGGGITAGVTPFSQSIGADVLASTGSQVLADAATAAVRAGAGALPQAVVSGDFGNVLTSALTAGATSGAVGGLSDLTGLSTKDINAAINFAQGAASGDYAKMLSSAGAFTDSPDLELASKAVRLVRAIESGNPSAIVSAGQAFGRELDGYNTRQTIERAYQDPSRQLDTITGTDLRDVGLRTTAGLEDLTTQDLVDIVNPPGQVATKATTAGAAPAGTGAVQARTTGTSTTTSVDTSGLPAFNNADIRTLEQSRAAEIIAEMYPGQSLNWVNQGVLNAAASHIRAGDEAGLRARLTSGQALGTGDAISGDVAVDYKAPAGTRVAQPGENAGILGYTERGTPVNLIQQLGTTAKRMTPEEKFAYDMANAGEAIDPLTGRPYELDTSANAQAIADVIRGPVSSLAGGIGEQAKLLGVAGGWIAGDRDNALKQWGSNVESWANSITPDSVKKGQDAISKQISEADGLPAKALAAVTGAATNPLATLHWIGKEAIQEVLPLGSAVAVGRTVSNATKLKFGEDLAQRYGLTSAIGTDATLNAGESATASYEEVYNSLRNQGVSEDKASSAAAAAAAGSGLVTLFTAAIGDAALVNKLMNNVKGATINATLKEGPTEFAEGALQSVAEQNATNLALGKGLVFDPNAALTSGTLEALIGSGTTATIAKVADVFTPTVADATTTGATTQTTAGPATQGRAEPTFDPNTVVATDPDTGDAITLGDLTGPSIQDAGTSTRIDPTLEALEGADIDSQQIISDYVNEVLGGNAPAAGSTADVVVGTDPETGAEVTLGDLGLTTPTAPTTAPAAAPATAAPAEVTVRPDATLATDAEGNTLTAADVGAAPAVAPATAPEGTTQPETKPGTQPAEQIDTGTQPDTQAEPAAAPDTAVAPAAAPDTKVEPKAPLDTQPATTPDTQVEPEAPTDAQPTTTPDTKEEHKAPSDTQPATTPDASQETKAPADTQPTATPDTQVEPKAPVDTQPTTEPDTKAEPDTTAEPKAPVDTQPATQPEAEPTTVVNPETKPTTDVAPDTQPKVDTQPDTKVAPTIDTQPEVKTEPAVETKVPTTVTPKVTPEPPPLPPGEDILPPVTEDELRDIVARPPTVSPPAPAPRAPAPSPAQTALAQLPPQQRAAVEQLLQDIFQAPEADLLEMFAELSEEREQKRKERGAQLKSRKA